MYIADLHIHSRYSMATSRDLTPPIWTCGQGKKEFTFWEPEILHIRHGAESWKRLWNLPNRDCTS